MMQAPPDGIMGQDTREAVTELQQENGLTPTGRINGRLLNALGLQ